MNDNLLQAWSYFLLFIMVENLLLWIDGKPTFRLNDGLTSIAHGVIQQCGRSEQTTFESLFRLIRFLTLNFSSICRCASLALFVIALTLISLIMIYGLHFERTDLSFQPIRLAFGFMNLFL